MNTKSGASKISELFRIFAIIDPKTNCKNLSRNQIKKKIIAYEHESVVLQIRACFFNQNHKARMLVRSYLQQNDSTCSTY